MSPRLVLIVVLALAAGLLAAVFLNGGGPESEAAVVATVPSGVPAEQSSLPLSLFSTSGERIEVGGTRTGLPLDVRLEGRVRDRLGTPLVGERVWLLRPGQEHPAKLGNAAKLRGAVTDEQGCFQLQLGPEHEWALSVGRIGDGRLTSEPVRFEPDHDPTVDVVVGGPAHLAVLVKGELGRYADARPALVEILRKAQPEDGQRIPFGKPGPTGFGAVPSDGEDVWNATAALPLTLGEPAEFTRLSVGDELRVAVVLGQERGESELVFVLDADEDARLVCELTADPDRLTLQVSFESDEARGAQTAGFDWH